MTRTGLPGASAKVPSPLPSRTSTVPNEKSWSLDTARSVFESLLIGPATSTSGCAPTRMGLLGAGVKPPAPFPSRMLTVSSSPLATATSSFVSPLKLPSRSLRIVAHAGRGAWYEAVSYTGWIRTSTAV